MSLAVRRSDREAVRAVGRPAGAYSLHLQIAADLRVMIFEGELMPGTRIMEGELCRRLGVSMTPLREALKVLVGQGLVDLLPDDSVLVSQIAGEETVELFEMMEGLEATIGELVVERITLAELDELKSLHHDMLEHHRRGRRAEYSAYNQRIHRRLVEAVRNRTLAKEHLKYSQAILQVRAAVNFTQACWDESMEEHCAIMDALEQRNGALLSALMRDHLRKTSRRIIANLASR